MGKGGDIHRNKINTREAGHILGSIGVKRDERNTG
jgi:hypothetical protein